MAQHDGAHATRRRRSRAGRRGRLLAACLPLAAALAVAGSGACYVAGHAQEQWPLLRAARGQSVSPPPVWLFRQAGRHLPEYGAYKAKRGKNFLELLRDPADVAEVTLQPLRRYDLDAAILFSDILVVADALGVGAEMVTGKGIVVPKPLELADIARLPPVDEVASPGFVEGRLGHVLEAVGATLQKMEQEGLADRPLIGFSAAPWTLLFYMVGGSSRGGQDIAEGWLREFPEASASLLSLLTALVVEYLSAQIRAGVHVVQVFEAAGGYIGRATFERYALPAMEEIAARLKERHPDVPIMVFPRGACYALPELQRAGYDVVTADCGTDLGEAALQLRQQAAGGRVAALQGNFDPKWLRAPHTEQDVARELHAMLNSAAGHPLIANLGEGLSGKELPHLVKSLVDGLKKAA